jgi:hypothetical protein
MKHEALTSYSQTNDAGESTSASIEETLAQRGSRYGQYKHQAELSQLLQQIIFKHASTNQTSKMEPYMIEALMMICHKLARIANGDPKYDDNWKDIAGYSQLVVDILHGKNP